MKSRILVVDDNADLTTLLAKTLEKFGYEVIVENHSSFALNTTRKVRPNLILLDVMMPDRDGGEVLRDLRNDVQLRSIPVIFLTALAREAHGLANQGGIESVVLSKPIELKLLLHEIDQHLEATKTFRQRMAEKLERETGEPVQKRGGNAFGGPDPAMFRREEPSPVREVRDSGLFSPFKRLLKRKKAESDVGMPR